ncbi:MULTISPECIES: restriction endonuclease subunit S [unclassified Myroides]|uniref:restriction endonuclease subunit S n=1 Tax=unclassified Myroides TaxID=2642485 RepID=UPI00310146B8
MMNIKINSAKTLTEQTQIGNFFKTLDSQINAQEQKHQKLINLKKAMLQKMFPKEGSDLPEIRFKGFTEKWEEKKLGNIVKIFNGYAFQSKNFVLFNSNIIVITPGNVKVCGGYQAEKGHYYNPNSQYLSKFKFEVNDIFITLTDLTPTGQTLGYPAIIPNDGNIYLHNQRLGKLFDIKTDRLFLYHFLCTNLYHTNVVSTSSGTTVKHSSSEKIQLIKIFVPSLKEQQKIGEYFEKLDNLIQQSQEQIKKYKNIKQALLQKMFV